MLLSVTAGLNLTALAKTNGDFEYEMLENSDAAKITKYNGSSSELVIPSEIDGYPVKAVGKEAFYNNKNLVEVTIPNGVTVIDEEAFSFCTNLKAVNCTNSIKEINMHAFLGCMALKDVYFDGTAEDWNAISIVNGKDDGNCFIIDAEKHYSSGNSCDITGHNVKINNAKPATVTEDGYTDDKVCVNCKKTIEKGTIIPAVTDIEISRTEINYTGTVQRPTVTVTDIYGNSLTYKKDFTVDYSDWNSTDIGRYTITITMQGNYSGSFSYPYYINPRPVSFLSSAQGGFKGIDKGFTLTWNKQTNRVTGYQLQFATKRDFSNAATVWINNPETTSCTITGRAAQTRYYVRIRAYTQIDNATFFGEWDYESNYVKSVVTK